MGNFRKLALLGAFALIIPNMAVMAADMPETPVVTLPPAVPFEFGSGWYLRGDLGYKAYSAPSAHFDVAGYGNMIDETLGGTGLAGIGFGYKFNQNFRADVTLDYEWDADFHGRLPCPSPCTPAAGQEYSDEYASINAWTGLFNVYYDLGTFGGFTPYVGAGIGAARVTTSNVTFTNPNGVTGTWQGASTWNLAWALTAGVSYNVSQAWAIDANYRYLNLGNAVSAPTTISNQPIHYDNISAHEFRIGVRYMIN